jgi:YjbE family integral membrane protein
MAAASETSRASSNTPKGRTMRFGILAAVAGIALLDMVLSGDNALVIGAAAAKLKGSQRRLAIIWGGLLAIVLRLLLAVGTVELLAIPLLQAVGAVVIFIIAIRLLLPEHERRADRRSSDRLWSAMLTIIVADVTMSLDNVIAVAGLAAGNILVLVLGIALSMVLLFVASALIARLMDYFSWLLDLAAVVLAWTAANLFLEDPVVGHRLPQSTRDQLTIHFGLVALILIVDLFLRAFRARSAAERERAAASAQADRAQPEMRDSIPSGSRSRSEDR